MSEFNTCVSYEFGYGWVARVSRVDDIGGKQTQVRICRTHWGANLYAKRWRKRWERLVLKGLVS